MLMLQLRWQKTAPDRGGHLLHILSQRNIEALAPPLPKPFDLLRVRQLRRSWGTRGTIGSSLFMHLELQGADLGMGRVVSLRRAVLRVNGMVLKSLCLDLRASLCCFYKWRWEWSLLVTAV